MGTAPHSRLGTAYPHPLFCGLDTRSVSLRSAAGSADGRGAGDRCRVPLPTVHRRTAKLKGLEGFIRARRLLDTCLAQLWASWSVSFCRLATPPVVRLQRVFPGITGIPSEAIRHTLTGVVALDGVQGLKVLYSHTSLLSVFILGPRTCWASKMADRGLAAQVQGRL